MSVIVIIIIIIIIILVTMCINCQPEEELFEIQSESITTWNGEIHPLFVFSLYYPLRSALSRSLMTAI